MYPQTRISYWAQFGILLGLFGAATLVASLVVIVIASSLWHIPLMQIPDAVTNPRYADMGRMAQGVAALVGMGLPALVFARILNRFPLQHLHFSSRVNWKQLVLVVVLIFFSLYVSGALAELNEHIPLSPQLTAKFKKLENDYTQQVMVLGNMHNLRDYFFTLLIIAFIPALVEEMLFRGCLQQLLIGLTKHAFTGILIASIIFSAIHLSYYGFLARLFLGMLLGYIYYYGKNIWLNVLAHFLNNALVVTQMYVLSRQGKLTADSINDSYPLYWGLIGLLAVLAAFYYFRKESNKLWKQPENAEEA